MKCVHCGKEVFNYYNVWVHQENNEVVCNFELVLKAEPNYKTYFEEEQK